MLNNRMLLAVALAASACTGTPGAPGPQRPDVAPRAEAAMPAQAPNPLLEPWPGPYGGVPPFDRVKLEQFRPAFEAAMAENRREIDAIVASPEAPSFENTIVALEDAGRTFNQVYKVYNAWASALSTPEFRTLEREMSPKLAAFWGETAQNLPLFRRVEAASRAAESSGLSPEQRRLAWFYENDFVRSGAGLDAAGRARRAEIDRRLATLYTSFAQNALGDEEQYAVALEGEADLAGLPESVRAGAAAEAEARGQKGTWLIANTRSAVADFLTHSSRRDLREKVWRNYDRRGDHGDARDNNAFISEILALRAERAKLSGHPTYAHWQLEASMLKTPERAMRLMEALWAPALARSREEVAAMQALADRSPDKAKIAPWDYRYYAEKVRKAKYDLDEAEIRPYLQLERLREGMFWVAGELFGLSFTPASGVPVYHPDVRVFEVSERASGRHVGLLYFDPYARPGKYNGGQTTSYRVSERMRGEVTALVWNGTPFVKPAPGEPALLGWRDAQTLFHEFGHALHVFCSSVTYPSLSGGRVASDYVEFPSKLLERWLSTPELLGRFARHYRTGEPMPAALAAKLKQAATFNQGFFTVEYLATALVEMKMHLETGKPVDPDVFERDTLKQLGAPAEVGMKFRMPHFGHAFTGDGYAAGYYKYLWADVLAADAFEAFTRGKGPYDVAVAARLREHVFATGNTVDPFEGYRAFRGREPSLDALLRERGFAGAPRRLRPLRTTRPVDSRCGALSSSMQGRRRRSRRRHVSASCRGKRLDGRRRRRATTNDNIAGFHVGFNSHDRHLVHSGAITLRRRAAAAGCRQRRHSRLSRWF